MAQAQAQPAVPSGLAAVKDHTRLFGAFSYVYPVISRRARGLSLGVNLNPDKVCNFDCIYCEVDRVTPPRTRRLDLDQLRSELTALIRHVKAGGLATQGRFRETPDLARDIKDMAFSGDGEPTLAREFAAAVQIVADVKRAEQLPSTKIVLITDAAGLDRADVKRGLGIMDANQGEVWGKLDAGTESYYRLVNRSHVRFDRILGNLLITAQARPIVIQSLFLRVHGLPMNRDELDSYCSRLEDLVRQGGQIKEVHAYTVARATPEVYATRLSLAELDGMADVIRRRTGLSVHTFD